MSNKALILVVDDSPTQLHCMCTLLETHYAVETAANGALAVAAVEERLPDLVVTDLQMPEMDGLELVAKLKADYPDLPIILTTSKGSEEIAAQALSLGAASYVPKRHLREELLTTIARILSMRDAGHNISTQPSLVAAIRLELILDNDDSRVADAIARIESALMELGLLEAGKQMQIATALDEALVNAIIHGNLQISSDLRHADDGIHYLREVQQRRMSEPYCGRRVRIVVDANRHQAAFTVSDEGPGFDFCSLPDPTDVSNLDKCGGRGLLLINAFMDEVRHNTAGNEITMIKRKSSDQ